MRKRWGRKVKRCACDGDRRRAMGCVLMDRSYSVLEWGCWGILRFVAMVWLWIRGDVDLSIVSGLGQDRRPADLIG
jgi:hypothetical protein